MTNLKTRYLGLTLKHPFMPGASPMVDDLDTVRRLEDAGASAIVMHSLFEEQISQEQLALHAYTDFHRDAYAEAGSFFPEPSAFVLGPDAYLRQLQRIKEAVAVPVIGSLNGTTVGGWLEYARLMEQAGADALELNSYQLAADPSVLGTDLERRALEVVKKVKATVRIPVAVKLSPFYSSLAHHAAELCAAGADGLILFNRFYQPDIDIDALEVRRAIRLSDPSELPLRLRWLAILSPQLKASLAVSGGVHDAPDAIRALMAGAHAVQLVSALLRHGPEHLSVVLRDVTRWLEEKEYVSLDALRGSMSLATCPDPAAYERANYMLMLQGWTTGASRR
jgi:dihydroorotate dehydrogenase (fumarate)